MLIDTVLIISVSAKLQGLKNMCWKSEFVNHRKVSIHCSCCKVSRDTACGLSRGDDVTCELNGLGPSSKLQYLHHNTSCRQNGYAASQQAAAMQLHMHMLRSDGTARLSQHMMTICAAS